MDILQPSDESRVLVIYTGGTIGMLVGPQGYRNEPQFLTETLRCQSRFHDPLEDSLYSHSGSIEGYRKWTSSGKSSPLPESSQFPNKGELPTLTVRSTRPIIPQLATDTQKPNLTDTNTSKIRCQKISDRIFECQLSCLVTPKSRIHGGIAKRIRYAILEVLRLPNLKLTSRDLALT